MKNAFLYAFRNSIPILISWIPVGLAYGILMQTAGLNWIWTGACSLFIFAGSLQFLAVSFFAGGVSIITVAVMALLLNSRHIFYGLPFLEKWKDYGIGKLFLVYTLSDEAFSLHCANDFEGGSEKEKKATYFFSAILTFFYWFVLSVLGAFLGSLITFDTTGIDFALTALFIVILIEQIKAAKCAVIPAIVASCSSIVCLIVLGPSKFILPSLLVTVCLLILLQGRVKKEWEVRGNE